MSSNISLKLTKPLQIQKSRHVTHVSKMLNSRAENKTKQNKAAARRGSRLVRVNLYEELHHVLEGLLVKGLQGLRLDGKLLLEVLELLLAHLGKVAVLGLDVLGAAQVGDVGPGEDELVVVMKTVCEGVQWR